MPEPEGPSGSCYGATPLTSAIERAVAAVGPERFLGSLTVQEQQAAPEVAVLPHLVSTAISARWGIPCEVITEW